MKYEGLERERGKKREKESIKINEEKTKFV